MDRVLFSFYYLRLLLEVLLGRHKTEHPLNLKWRWSHWRRMREHRGFKLF